MAAQLTFGNDYTVKTAEFIVCFDLRPGQICITSGPDGPESTNNEINRIFYENNIVKAEKLIPSSCNKDYLPDSDTYITSIYLLQHNGNRTTESIIDDFNNCKIVRYAEKIPEYYPHFEPNDPLYSLQWAIPDIKADQAWDFWDIPSVYPGNSSNPGSKVLIGIVDSGINKAHEDLAGQLYVNPAEDYNNNGVADYLPISQGGDLDGVDSENDSNDVIDDLQGWDFYDADNDISESPPYHGFLCAGIAGAATNNNLGTASPGFDMCITATKHNGGGTVYYDVLQGMQYIAELGQENGMHTILSLSFGSSEYSQAPQDVINNLYENYNCLIFASAGNYGNKHYPGIGEGGNRIYPGDYENVIGVAATKHNNRLWENSDYGEIIELSAPGYMIYTIAGIYEDGTSMACPLAASAAGLIWSYRPEYSNNEVRQVLISGLDDISGYNPEYNAEDVPGKINLYSSVSLGIGQDQKIIGGNLPVISSSPNPFKNSTNISFFLSKGQKASVDIFNIRGKKIKTLFTGTGRGAVEKIIWNGKNTHNENVANGTYLCLVTIDKEKHARKILLIK